MGGSPVGLWFRDLPPDPDWKDYWDSPTEGALVQEVNRLRHEAWNLRRYLREREWDDEQDFCNTCGASRIDGHKPGCGLDKLLNGHTP